MTESAKRVLVVDDDEGIRNSLSRILRASGHDVRVAADGFEAIDLSRTFDPHLVLIDIRMPGIDGVETFQRLRSLSPSLAAIFMTAYSSSQQRHQAEERGAISVLAKPLQIDRLLDLVQSSLRAAPVLIADDDPSLLKSMARAIRAQGLEVETVSTLQQAALALRQRPRRVVVADVFLQDGFGYELMRDLASEQEPLPFVLITGRSDWLTSDVGQRLQARVVCLSKPIDIDQLIQQVNR